MTLDELIAQYRLQLADETVGVRRSWEEMFKYTLRLYPGDTPLEAFDPDSLTETLLAAGLHRPIVDGYVKRWRALLNQANRL